MNGEIHSYLSGKVQSYWENARIDALISRYLISYVKTGKIPQKNSESANRAKKLIKNTPVSKKKDRIMVQAFTEFWINGGANYMYSQMLSASLPEDLRARIIKAYEDVDTKFFNMLFLWYEIVRGNHKRIHDFAEQHSHKLNLTKKQIETEIVRVQKANIKINYENRDILNSGERCSREKIRNLRKFAKKVNNRKVFISAAASTQESAARWDKLLIIKPLT